MVDGQVRGLRADKNRMNWSMGRMLRRVPWSSLGTDRPSCRGMRTRRMSGYRTCSTAFFGRGMVPNG